MTALVAVGGKFSSLFDLSHWLAVNAADIWHGQVWRLIAYPLLPVGVLDFLMNSFALVLLGSQLERHWTRGQLIWFCVIAAAGAGSTQVTLSPLPLIGAAPMIFGLLIGWAVVCGHEVLRFPIFGQMSVRQMVTIFSAVSSVTMVFSAGWLRTTVLLSGGVTGWFYLWLQHKWLMARASQSVQSERISRLEL